MIKFNSVFTILFIFYFTFIIEFILIVLIILIVNKSSLKLKTYPNQSFNKNLKSLILICLKGKQQQKSKK